MIDAGATTKSSSPPPSTPKSSAPESEPKQKQDNSPTKAPEPRPSDAEVDFSPQAQAELDSGPSQTDTPDTGADTPETVADSPETTSTSSAADTTVVGEERVNDVDVAAEAEEVAEASDIEGVEELAESGELEELLPPDFNLMTEEEQYAYLEEVVLEASGDNPDAWKVEPGEVNLVGIRSFQDGQPTTPEGDVYNDSIYAAWMDEDGEVHVEGYQASTDAGVVNDPEATGFGYSNNQGYQGLSHLADGFYEDTWETGGVPHSDLGLRQKGDIQIHADANNDGIINPEERLGEDTTGDGMGDGVTQGEWWGIQFHPGGSSDRDVNLWSAGCQVIVDEEYADFKEVIGSATNDKFSYTLIDSSDLPPVDASHAARPPAATSAPSAPPVSPQIPEGAGLPTPGQTPAPAPPAETVPAPIAQVPSVNQPAPATQTAPVAESASAPVQAAAPQATAPQAAAPQAAAPQAESSQAPAPQAPPSTPLPNEFQQQIGQMLPGMSLPDNFNDLILFLLSQLSAGGQGMGAWGFARNQMSQAQLNPVLQMVMQQAQASGVSLSVPAQQQLNNAGVRLA
jgi:hypothetical protein